MLTTAQFAEHYQVAYTTVMTNLKTLERKCYLRTSQQERAHVYRPAKPKQQVVRAMVREFIDRVFDGSARPLLLHMIEDDQLTDAEFAQARFALGHKPAGG